MGQIFDQLNDSADIQRLIDSAERESPVLEYKRADSLWDDRAKNEIVKDVSALANSGGGTMIFGVEVSKTDKTLPISVVPLERRNIEIVDQILNSGIRPPVRDIRKKLIPREDPQVMVLEIPQSDEAPHQSIRDNKYYRRAGVESLPMEHDLIALYFGRRRSPSLDLRFDVTSTNDDQQDGRRGTRLELRGFIVNSGKRIARYVVPILEFPPKESVIVGVASNGSWTSLDRLRVGTQARQIRVPDVVHPGLSISAIEFSLWTPKNWLNNNSGSPIIEWAIFADEMPQRTGKVTVAHLISGLQM